MQGFVKTSYEVASALADFHFLGDVAVFYINHELQPIVFFWEVGELDELRRIVRPLHVEHLELAEITGHNPAWALRVG